MKGNFPSLHLFLCSLSGRVGGAPLCMLGVGWVGDGWCWVVGGWISTGGGRWAETPRHEWAVEQGREEAELRAVPDSPVFSKVPFVEALPVPTQGFCWALGVSHRALRESSPSGCFPPPVLGRGCSELEDSCSAEHLLLENPLFSNSHWETFSPPSAQRDFFSSLPQHSPMGDDSCCLAGAASLPDVLPEQNPSVSSNGPHIPKHWCLDRAGAL